MFDQIKTIFHKTIYKPLLISYKVDVDDIGRHLVQIAIQRDGEFQKKIDFRKISSYGYHEERLVNNQLIIFNLQEQDRHILLALKSMNPEVQTDGTLVFDIEPFILNYLRKNNIEETQQAQQVSIVDDEIAPTARVNFDPINGLIIETGFDLGSDKPLLSDDKIKTSLDGRYIRVKNTFLRLAKIKLKQKEILKNNNQVIPLHQIPEFFQRDLIVLKQEMNAVLTDSVNQIRIINSEFKPVVTVKKESAGWLDFNITFESSGFHLPQSILEKAKAENEKYIQLEPSTWIAFDKKNYSKIEQELSDLNAISGEFGFRVPVSEFATLEEFINSIGGRSELDKAYQDFLDQLIGFVPDHKFSLPAEIESHLENENLHLRPYQRGGIQWLHWLKQNQLHGILADDMGLGKTLESLIALRMGLLEDTNNINHSLIVAPKSVLIHWEREILRVFPTVNIHLYQGSNRNKNILKSNQPYIVITTYETITKDADFFARIPFYYLILDEATRIKNPDSHRSRAIKSLNAAHRLALSGTPVENRPSELWSLFDFLMRGHLGKQGTFKNVFEQAIISGDDSAAQRLGKRIRPFLLRRKKEDVATDIPEKIEITEWVTLTSEQRMLYASLQAEITGLRNKIINGNISNYSFSVLPVLTKLKQICDHPALLTGKINPIYNRSEKFDWMIEKIEEINNDNEQVVVFSHFLNMLSIFESAIKEKGISYIRIDGSTNNRQEYIDIFNNGKARVALLSLMATGYGINLTAANHVIHADRWWNPAVEDQATDRVHRIGQNKTVYVYQVLNQGTMEEKIELLLSKKRGMANQIINAATRGSSRWSREELLELLSPLG